jgi:diguanylate cyclase (GGDEF)-like protein
MQRESAARALLRAADEAAGEVRALLTAAGCEVDEPSVGDWAERLEAGPACAVADRAGLEALPASARARLGELRSRVPLLVIGCEGEAEVAAALSDGAAFALRADAGRSELGAALRLALKIARLSRDCREAREDLRRHAALVMKDDLTAAYNRRFFERCLEDELDRARRFDSTVSLIFMDIDNLRDVNQEHGHSMGSRVLREAAARTIRTIRSIDKCVRYGGDEFCVILPETDWRGALEVAERIRRNFASRPFRLDGTEITLTASFGVASFPEHALTKSEIIKAADEAMFAVKGERKNGILVAGGKVR